MTSTTQRSTAMAGERMNQFSASMTEFNLSEALFVVDGKLAKGDIEYPSSTDYTKKMVGSDPDKIEKIHDTLRTILQAFNQHAVVINKISEKQGSMVPQSELISAFNKIEGAISLYDAKFVDILEISDAAKYDEGTSNLLMNETHKVCNKVLQLGHACHYLYKRGNEHVKEMNLLQDKIKKIQESKLSVELFNREVANREASILEKVDLLFKDDQKQQEKLKMTLFNKQGELERKMDNVSRQHLKKLTDVESLLESRASKQYVDDFLRELEAKFQRTLLDESSKNEISIKSIQRKAENEQNQIKEDFRIKLAEYEGSFDKVRELIADKVDHDMFEDNKKAIENKMISFSNRIRENKTRYDPLLTEMHNLKTLKEQFLDHEERFIDFQNESQTKMSYISSELEEIRNMPPPVIEQKIELPHIPQIDENDFEDMKFNVKQLRSENNSIHDMLKKVKESLGDKVDSLIFDKNMEKKIDKDDVYYLMEKFSLEDDRMKKVQHDIASIIKRMDYIGEKMDKKIIRLKKELDLTSIQKLLKSKADDSEVKKEFENTDFKVKCMNETMGGVKKDLDGMYNSLRKISDVISILQQEQASALASTKNALCLSCGRGDANFLPPMSQVKGNDGNYYKTYGKDSRRPGNIKAKENYDYGYEVFNTKEIVREHEVANHEPSDTYYNKNSKKSRPFSAIGGSVEVKQFPTLQQSKELPKK